MNLIHESILISGKIPTWQLSCKSTIGWRRSCSERNWLERHTTMQGEVTRISLLVIQTLESLGIPYPVGGSLASSVHGVMRSTLDVDIVADMRLEHVQPLVAAQDVGHSNRPQTKRICHRPRRRHPLQTRMVSYGRRSLRSSMARHPWCAENQRRRTRSGLPAQVDKTNSKSRTCSNVL